MFVGRSGAAIRAALIGLSFLFLHCNSHAATQVKKDQDDLKSLFISVADVYGQFMLACNRNDDLVKMISTVVFAEKAYKKLNRGFPSSNPPLDEQIFSRIELSCKLFGCGPSTNDKKCNTKVSDGTDSIMWRYDHAMTRINDRLKKAGIDVAKLNEREISASHSACPLNAQHYQDAYIQNSRIDDLICFKQAINREFR